MNKQEFLEQLRKGLTQLPQRDKEERLTFYSEMIDDRIEEGLSEDEAVSAVGSVEEIVAQIMADVPPVKSAKEKTKSKRRLKTWEIVLLALGSPIWLSLAIAAASVIIAICAVMWSVIVALAAIVVAVIATVLAGIVMLVVFAVQGNALQGMMMLGTAFVCLGVTILAVLFTNIAVKAVIWLIKKVYFAIKSCFVKREAE